MQVKIDDLCDMLQQIKSQRGNLECFCGDSPIAGFSIIPAELIHRTDPDRRGADARVVLSIIPRRG